MPPCKHMIVVTVAQLVACADAFGDISSASGKPIVVATAHNRRNCVKSYALGASSGSYSCERAPVGQLHGVSTQSSIAFGLAALSTCMLGGYRTIKKRSSGIVALRPIGFDGSLTDSRVNQGTTVKPRIEMLLPKAKKGDRSAQLAVATAYYTGDGAPKDPTLAAEWLAKAAEQGLPDAQYMIGQMLYSGDGIPMNKEWAMYWLRLACEQGVPNAKYLVGVVLHEGDGVEKDVGQGVEYLASAVSQGVQEAVNYVSESASEPGYPEVQCLLGRMLQSGKGVAKNGEYAFYWFEQAANKGSAEGQYNLGLMLKSGEGVPANAEFAKYWLEQAAAQGYTEASQGERPMLSGKNIPGQAPNKVSAGGGQAGGAKWNWSGGGAEQLP